MVYKIIIKYYYYYYIINYFLSLYIIYLFLLIFSLLNGLSLDVESILNMNAAEDSSQGLQPSGSQTIDPEGSLRGLQPSGSPNRSPDPNESNSILDNNNVKDTEILARHFEIAMNGGNKLVDQTGIKFSDPTSHGFRNRTTGGQYYETASRIARYININHRGDIFYWLGPQKTPLSSELIQKIRNLNENVPVNFR